MIPIATSTSIRRTPMVNYALIAMNVIVYLVLGGANAPGNAGSALTSLREQGVLSGGDPQLYQFITYQFLHGDLAHIGFNMLFLWVFGNPVNAKMGDGPYLLFYLAGGVFAAVGYAWQNDVGMVGASGAIAAVTTAYLALFPRSYVTILYWWFFIGTFELPSMILILFKLVLFDNILATSLMGDSMVAYGAHLYGYAFGITAAAGMLWLGVLPRDQFDIVALWKRWIQRQSMRTVMASPDAQARAQFGRVARPVNADDIVEEKFDELAGMRSHVTEALSRGDREAATVHYDKLLELDPRQVLGRPQQLDVANQYYTMHRLPQAAAAYEKYLSHYPNAPDRDQVKLLLGIIYARDLQQFEVAQEHLRQVKDRIHDEKRLAQCQHWLDVAAQALGRPATGS